MGGRGGAGKLGRGGASGLKAPSPFEKQIQKAIESGKMVISYNEQEKEYKIRVTSDAPESLVNWAKENKQQIKRVWGIIQNHNAKVEKEYQQVKSFLSVDAEKGQVHEYKLIQEGLRKGITQERAYSYRPPLGSPIPKEAILEAFGKKGETVLVSKSEIVKKLGR
jgi:uncharacterized protein (DUF2344 family)